MWMTRISHGVLQVSTNSGARYLKPCVWERMCLLWIFRNFKILPQQVLTQRQRRLIRAVWSHRKFANPEKVEPFTVIGTIEMTAVPLRFAPVSLAFGASRRVS